MSWRDTASKVFEVGKKYYYHDSFWNKDVLCHCCSKAGDVFGFQVMMKDKYGLYQPTKAKFECKAHERADGLNFVYVCDGKFGLEDQEVMTAWDRWGTLDEF